MTTTDWYVGPDGHFYGVRLMDEAPETILFATRVTSCVKDAGCRHLVTVTEWPAKKPMGFWRKLIKGQKGGKK